MNSSSILQPIRVEDFAGIVETNDAFFLYLQTFDTTVDELVSLAVLEWSTIGLELTIV